MLETSKTGRYVKLFVLALGAVSIYLLPYLRWTYYDTLLAAVNLTNAQFGATMSIYGIAAMIFYAPGGCLADKFSCRKMLAFAFASTGALGIYYATFPGYAMQMLIMLLWGGIGTLFFWSALMKVTRSLGDNTEQGRMFGLLESGRGLGQLVISFIALYFYSKLGETIGSLAGIIIGYSVLCFIAAILVWFFIEDKIAGAEGEKIQIKDIGAVLRIPAVWLIAVIVLSCYSVYLGSTYLTPYLTQILGLTATLSAFLAIVRNYLLQLLGGFTGGLISDKIGSVTFVIAVCFMIIVVALAGFVFLPPTPDIMIIALVLMLLFSTAIFAMRGIYFAPMDECRIPRKLTGTAVGLISVIGFFPDVYMNTIAGTLLDAYPGAAGYRILFLVMLAFAVFGFAASIFLDRMVKKYRNNHQEKSEIQA